MTIWTVSQITLTFVLYKQKLVAFKDVLVFNIAPSAFLQIKFRSKTLPALKLMRLFDKRIKNIISTTTDAITNNKRM